MRKIKDVLRLRHEAGLGQRQIARSCAIAQATVAKYLKRAEAAGIASAARLGRGSAAEGGFRRRCGGDGAEGLSFVRASQCACVYSGVRR
jgi:hypothetical protein